MRLSTLASALTVIWLATPVLADEVNIYSYRQPELLQPLLDGFTAQTGIKTNVAFVNRGLIDRLKAEGKRSPADIILTTDISRLAGAKEAGVTQSVSSDALDTAIPENLRDPEGHWFAMTTRARIIYASNDRVKPGEITTYEDLANPKWKGRICTRSGTHEYTLGLIGAMMAHNGIADTEAWLKGVKANLAREPEGNDRAQVKAIWAGVCDISLGNTYYMGAMLDDPEQAEWANSVRIDFPTFEDGAGTHINVSGVAMTASAPNHDAAIKFIEYLASPEAQALYAAKVNEYPARSDAKVSERVAAWGAFKADAESLADIAANRAEALRLAERVNFDGAPDSGG